jgi:molybdenum cofactor cytidylyltransferase
MEKQKLNGLLVSAGYSGRMGAFKPLLSYQHNPYVVVIVKKLLSVCEYVTVVTGFNNSELYATIRFGFVDGLLFPRVNVVHNDEFQKGMFSSLQTGLKSLSKPEWILYHFIDQPFHEKKFYSELVGQISNDFDWIQPVYSGKEGHPVIFNEKVADKIIDSPPESILRTIRDLPGVRKKYWNCPYQSILKDYDTPEDVEK